LQERDGKLDQAIKTYEKVLAEEPLYVPAMRQLAVLQAERSTDVAKAYDLALKAREAYPDDAEVTKALGILSYRRELYSRSLELLKQAEVSRADDPELFYYFGAVYHQLKQWNECKQALERAWRLKLPPKLAREARQVLAECSDPSSQDIR